MYKTNSLTVQCIKYFWIRKTQKPAESNALHKAQKQRMHSRLRKIKMQHPGNRGVLHFHLRVLKVLIPGISNLTRMVELQINPQQF